jgi:methionyl aminopeptidase
LTIDVGTENEGWFVDSARTRIVPGKINKDAERLIEATEAILMAQLNVVKNDCNFLSMVQAAEAAAKQYEVTIMPQWGGHGISRVIHDEPFIPSAIDRTFSKIKQDIQAKRYSKQKLQTGQTICIEPVVTFGSSDIIIDEDQWTVRQAESQLTAHSERCLIVTENGYEIIS